MLNKLNFLLIMLLTYKKKHLSIFVISSFLIALVSSIVFLSSSIKRDIYSTLANQADFTLQQYKAGKVLNTPVSWLDDFLSIDGVSNVQGRVYGMHYYEPLEQYFMIVGIDFYDNQVIKEMEKLIDSIDIDKFLAKKNMIIGSDVKKFLDEYHYFDYYTFRPPDRSIEKVYIYDTFDSQSDIVSSDMIIMHITDARTILGVEDGFVTDYVLSVPNKEELETIRIKLKISHFDMRVITNDEIKKYYENLFNYKGGVFLVLYLIVIVTFSLILYQRYSIIKDVDAKEVAIFRVVGWKINEIIWFKISENFLLIVSAYLLGVIIAYFYVFVFDAPLLKYIFLGYSNLGNSTSFSPSFSLQEFSVIFLVFAVPYLVAILIPLWRLSIKDPTEIIK